ncbi:RIB43A domain with coiled coils 1 [Paragonimus heterotremus]|uniref:RIB43A domain with coiled coils 1 n=1 Tax=Paragonimus heterotremus TaxID=100268 RepID=A0A8J4WGI1_9TREM|nr:RIB43A domain with coiled coils 1 [Paragonimus heterotremus]
MYKLDLPIDNKEAQIIEARRQREQERQARIFNARTRIIGIDEQSLKQQIEERKEQEKREKLRDQAYYSDANRNDKIACILQRRQEQDIREINRSLNEFRALHQQPNSRREFDLYDPEALKKDRPARVSDDDPRCGVSSIQKFEGEDLNSQARNQYQREQMQNWFERQIEERKRAEAAQKEAERLNGLKRRELDQRACELAKAEEECRRAINVAVQRFNAALKTEQEQRKLMKSKQEQDDNMTEICNAIYSDLLTENPAQAISAFGPNRYVADRYKGMSPEQIAEIHKKQQEQIEEKERLKAEEKARDAEWDEQRVKSARLGILLEREIERSKKEIQKRMAEENLKLTLDQKAFQKYLDSEVYTNQPTADYFTQFNTTSR